MLALIVKQAYLPSQSMRVVNDDRTDIDNLTLKPSTYLFIHQLELSSNTMIFWPSQRDRAAQNGESTATMSSRSAPSKVTSMSGEIKEPLDLSHHVSRVTKQRKESSIKEFYKYFAIPGIGNLAGGMSHAPLAQITSRITCYGACAAGPSLASRCVLG